MTRGKLDIACAFDSDGKLMGLRILEIKPNALPLDEVMKQFSSLSGDVSLLVSSRDKSKTKEWTNVLCLNEHKPLGVGSAFKMVVLRALLAEIEAGKRRWSDVVELQESDFSLSSMALDDYP